MSIYTKNKNKIINDPIYGFIEIPTELIYNLIEHEWVQRQRRINQLGLTNYVYPAAVHSRFQHIIGAMHLTNNAIEILRNKNTEISPKEKESTLIAVLLHDMGHSPYSHTLEHSFVHDLTHEEISLIFMQELNDIFDNKLETAIKIFKGEYHKKFLHALVSSQLDMDRLDYLGRDSFFSGVSEGVVGVDRIIKMLNVENNELVVEQKGIYSVEKFLIARRIMYWQVYLHKTVIAAEQMLNNIITRAKELSNKGKEIFTTPALYYFLNEYKDKSDFTDADKKAVRMFADLDDYDILCCIKQWKYSEDKILSDLCEMLLSRNLYYTEIQNKPFDSSQINEIKNKIKAEKKLSDEEVKYYVFSNTVSNNAYKCDNENINILFKTGEVQDIAFASDISNIHSLSETVQKYFLCRSR